MADHNELGKIGEELAEKHLRRIGYQILQRNWRFGHDELDIIARDGEWLVIVEVKTTLRPDDIDDFHKKLWKAKTYMPEYHDKIIYGAVAFITADSSSDQMAENQGFFVIRATGSSSSIVNKPGFKPKAF